MTFDERLAMAESMATMDSDGYTVVANSDGSFTLPTYEVECDG